MNNKKNKQTLSDKLETTHNHLKSFVEGLKEVAEEMSESEFEQYLKVDILPPLLEDDTVYSDSIWSKMDVVKIVQIDSVLKEREYSIQQSIYSMNADAICWLHDHIFNLNKIIEITEGKISKSDEWHMKGLKEDSEQLKEWIDLDIYDRIRNYESEIKKLLGVEA